jgi:hypothetical protein
MRVCTYQSAELASPGSENYHVERSGMDVSAFRSGNISRECCGRAMGPLSLSSYISLTTNVRFRFLVSLRC